MEKARQSNLTHQDIFKVTSMFEDTLCTQYVNNKTNFSKGKIMSHFRDIYFRSDRFY